MGIQKLRDHKTFSAEGSRIGRVGMSERVIEAVTEWQAEGSSYKGAMRLAGRLKAIAMMAASDEYWREQVETGMQVERAKSRVILPTPEATP